VIPNPTVAATGTGEGRPKVWVRCHEGHRLPSAVHRTTIVVGPAKL
jgi:hypothetical protein